MKSLSVFLVAAIILSSDVLAFKKFEKGALAYLLFKGLQPKQQPEMLMMMPANMDMSQMSGPMMMMVMPLSEMGKDMPAMMGAAMGPMGGQMPQMAMPMPMQMQMPMQMMMNQPSGGMGMPAMPTPPQKEPVKMNKNVMEALQKFEHDYHHKSTHVNHHHV